MARKSKGKKGYRRKSLARKALEYSVPRLAYGAAKYAGKSLYNRYVGSPYAMENVARDVAMLKGLINAEKKRLNINNSGSVGSIGQVSANTSGHYLQDITPLPAQGSGYNQRTGNSIKWTSSYFDIQIRGQSALSSPVKGRIYFFKVKGTPYGTVSNVMGQFIAPNTFIGDQTIYDMYSQRQPDYFKNFQPLLTKRFKIPADNITGQAMITSLRFGMKVQGHVKWSTDNTTLSEGQVIMLIVVDNGNSSSTTANTSTSGGVVNQAISTGLIMNYNIQHYFVDN